MNKQDLIAAVADSSGLTKGDASKAVEAVFDAITGSKGYAVGSVRTQGQTVQVDVVLQGRGTVKGTVVDGTGAPARRADVAIAGDRVVAVDERGDARATREIDAEGASPASRRTRHPRRG